MLCYSLSQPFFICLYNLISEDYCNSNFHYDPPKPIPPEPTTRLPSQNPEQEKDNYVPVIIGAVVITIVLAVGASVVYIVHKRKSPRFDHMSQQELGDGMGRTLLPQNQNSIVPLR